MDNERKLLNLISLAQKAGKVASGEFRTEKAVKGAQAALVILSSDASDNTKKKFRNMCEWYHVPVFESVGKDDLGHLIGRGERSCLAVTDEGFASSMRKLIGTDDTRR